MASNSKDALRYSSTPRWAIFEEAKSWVNAPYTRTGSGKDGTNCLGFVGGVLKAIGVLESIPEGNFEDKFWERPGDLILDTITKVLPFAGARFIEIDAALIEAGDILVLSQFKNLQKATHVAICGLPNRASPPRIIHARQGTASQIGCVEYTRMPPWKILKAYRAVEWVASDK